MSHKPGQEYALDNANSQTGYPGPPPDPAPAMPLICDQPRPGMHNDVPPGSQPCNPHPYPSYPLSVCQQPTHQVPPDERMAAPVIPRNCPPGLEYLSMIDEIQVHQKLELLEVLVGFETNNKYCIKNKLGQKIYYAVEDNDCCTRNCCGPIRPFDMKIIDNFGNEVIHLNRPLACDSCCCPCCLQSMEVSAPPGTVIGTIEQEWSIWKPRFVVKNAAGDVVLKIKGPFCICGVVDFHLYSQDGETKVGKITKQWSGFVREMFTDCDNFGISFPMDLDVKMKAVLLGACFLIMQKSARSGGKKGGKRTLGSPVKAQETTGNNARMMIRLAIRNPAPGAGSSRSKNALDEGSAIAIPIVDQRYSEPLYRTSCTLRSQQIEEIVYKYNKNNTM